MQRGDLGEGNNHVNVKYNNIIKQTPVKKSETYDETGKVIRDKKNKETIKQSEIRSDILKT